MTAYRLLKFCSLILLSLGASCKDKDMVPGTHNPPMESGLYVTDFSEYTTGAAPSDWTKRYNTGSFSVSVETVAGSLSGKALRWTKTASARQGLSWDRVPPAANVEILLRARSIESGWAAGNNFIGPYARGGGGLGTENGYRAVVSGQTDGTRWSAAIGSYLAGTTVTDIGAGSQGPSPNYTVNTWFWMRFRVIGTSLSRRLWQQGQSEPAGWDETITNSTVSAAGWSGLQQVSTNPNVEIDYFAVSVGGATIPVPN